MNGKILQMPHPRQDGDPPKLQETVLIFHESADCPGMLAEKTVQEGRVSVYCTECNQEIGSFLPKEWRSIVEFLALLPPNEAA